MSDLWDATAAAQAELVQPRLDGVNPHFKSRYATLPAVMEAAKVYARHGVAVEAELSAGPPVVYRCRLRLGGEVGSWCEFPVVARGQSAQELGAALTYARRYAMQALLGLAGDDDDDGEIAEGRGKPEAPRQAVPNPAASRATPPPAECEKSSQSEPPAWARSDAKLAVTLEGGELTPGAINAALNAIASLNRQTVPSENGASAHTVTRQADGGWVCGCQGYTTHKKCRHCAIAELTHRATVLGDKYVMSSHIDALSGHGPLADYDNKALGAELETTDRLRTQFAPNAGPWAWPRKDVVK